ncbi:hypothetical protein [uncultured Rhodoblastus sp.]|uniref:hypothetical protein n=1 Tax=uncultured Rhodoblastus sp. TaxID=543037 RepID=UPI0025DE5FAB|nr:hypothetical protein [uncultured Rhodoblastus sp.]
MRALIDLLFRVLEGFRFSDGIPDARRGGKLRNGARESVSKVLERIGAPFTASEMRHVGV